MANTFHAQILTPNGKVFEGEVFGAKVPGTSGSFEMKFNHAPIISTIDIGSVRIITRDLEEHHFAVSGGFVEMNNNKMTLLAEAAEHVKNIDKDRAIRAKDRALRGINEKKPEREDLNLALKRAQNRLKLLAKYGPG